MLLCLVASGTSLLIRHVVPPLILANAVFDDLHFVRLASSLTHGDWLGPFDSVLTLSKGPGYPMFLSACSGLGINFLLAQQLLHLAAAATMAWVLSRLTKSRWLGALTYTGLVLDPNYFGAAGSSVRRDSFYASTSLLLLALIARGLCGSPATSAIARWRFLRALVASALVGAAFSFYWLTREERPWLVPALILLVAARLWWQWPLRKTAMPRIIQALVGVLVAVAMSLGMISAVASVNKHVYGVAVTNDMSEGSFAQAFGEWQTVRAGPIRPYVLISRQMREAVYEVSPRARELAFAMDGLPDRGSAVRTCDPYGTCGPRPGWVGAGWTASGCAEYGICDDVAGGWIPWALRDSLKATRRHVSAPAVQAYWRQVSADISAACSTGRLRCRSTLPFLAPQPDTIRAGAWVHSSVAAFRWVAAYHLGDLVVGSADGTSTGTTPNWELFHQTVPGVPSHRADELRIEQEFAADGQGKLRAVADLFRLVTPPLLVVSVAGYGIALFRRRPGWVLPAVVGAVAWTAVLCRVLLIGLVDSTAFAASKNSYMLPASSLLIVGIAVGVWLLVHATRGQPDAVPPSQGPAAEDRTSVVEVTVLLPCLNEALTLERCVHKATASLAELGVSGEVLVADNGSTDGSQEIARAAGARVIDVPVKGYGAALRAGIESARGHFVIMADADDSYALETLGPFVDQLRAGNDLVVGNRFLGGIAPGAMPALHRYLGNPVLSLIGRMFFRIPVRDFHCGIRGFRRDKALALRLRSDGMEFASELIVKFALTRGRIVEVPTILRKDGRDRPPHLRSWRDGWRHLRFLLLFSPRWLFLYPGVGLTTVGTLLMLRLSLGSVAIGDVVLDTQSLLFAGSAVVIGVQAILFAMLSRRYAASRGILPPSLRLQALSHPFALERGALLAAGLLTAGVVGSLTALLAWAHHGFGPLDVGASMRIAVPAVTCLSVGAEILLASFFLGLLQLDDSISTGSPSLAEPVGRTAHDLA